MPHKLLAGTRRSAHAFSLPHCSHSINQVHHQGGGETSLHIFSVDGNRFAQSKRLAGRRSLAPKQAATVRRLGPKLLLVVVFVMQLGDRARAGARLCRWPMRANAVIYKGYEARSNNDAGRTRNMSALVKISGRCREGQQSTTYSATSVMASMTDWSLIHMKQGGIHPPARSSAWTWFGLCVSCAMWATDSLRLSRTR